MSSIIHLISEPITLTISVCCHTCFLYACLQSISGLHICEANVLPAQPSPQPLPPFSIPDARCGHWLLPCIALSRSLHSGGSQFCSGKSPNVSQNKPYFCFRSGPIRRLITLVLAYRGRWSNRLRPRMSLLSMSFLNTSPGGTYFVMFSSEKRNIIQLFPSSQKDKIVSLSN